MVFTSAGHRPGRRKTGLQVAGRAGQQGDRKNEESEDEREEMACKNSKKQQPTYNHRRPPLIATKTRRNNSNFAEKRVKTERNELHRSGMILAWI